MRNKTVKSSANKFSQNNTAKKINFVKKTVKSDESSPKKAVNRGFRTAYSVKSTSEPFVKTEKSTNSRVKPIRKSTNVVEFDSDEKPIFKKKINTFDKNFTNRVNKLTVKKNEEKSIFDEIRLNKFIANAGICSRREADELIKNGLVEVNGKVIVEMGYKVMKTDTVRFDDKILRPEKPIYVLLNKPKGFITTTKDENMRKTVLDLVAKATPYRIFPVGRLDRPTTGVLLLTNDGEMTKKLTHPSHGVKKIYHVTLNQKLSHEHFEMIKNEGVHLFEGLATVDSISYIEGKPKNEVGVEIHIGWNRVVRRIFEKLGYEVEFLDRVLFAGLTKKNLKRGDWRILNEQEISNLKML